MGELVRIASHAKVNLFLRLLARETTGFHSIETLFSLLDLHDELTVERTAHGIELAVEGADTGPDTDNLAYRAAQMILDATGERFGVRIRIRKSIPVRAGLGGGSSNGAAALHAVNRLADEAVPRHELLQFAAKLGSDVPFFAAGAAMALGWNRGERLYRLRPPPASPVLLALPPVEVSTKAAYELVSRSSAPSPRGPVVFDVDAFQTWGGIGRLGGNDFESPLFGKMPELRSSFERLAQSHPLVARLTGSGSAIVAVYRNDRDRDAAALEVGERDHRLIKTQTRDHAAPGPEPV